MSIEQRNQEQSLTDEPFPEIVKFGLETREYLEAKQTNEKESPFCVISYSANEIHEMEIKEEPYIFYPWLRRSNIAMISAPAGIGKTFLALTISEAITTGGRKLFDGRWRTQDPHRVLYLDGEMSSSTMKQRLAMVGIKDDNFRLVNSDFLPKDSLGININRLEWQLAIREEIEKQKTEVVVIDNVACLYRSDKTNQSESWLNMQDFLLSLRRDGITAIVIDHQGKSTDGSARGTSAKSDVLDVAISLKRPEDYQKSQGARFEIHFTKARGFYGDEAEPFEVWLQDGIWTTSPVKETTDGTVKRGRPISEDTRRRIEKALREEKTPTEIIGLGIGKRDNVYRVQKMMKAEAEAANDENWGNVRFKD